MGGSAGALTGLQRIFRALPWEFPAAVFVVVHTPADSPGTLPLVLKKSSSLPVRYAVDHDVIRSGYIYVAPPDHHLVIKRGYVRVTRGPRENRSRPAIDPLFRTAAAAYGPRVIGVILSGGQDDGVVGLAHIKRRGGVVIAQEPSEADAPSMPEHAIQQVAVDHVLRVDDMASIISGLVRAPVKEDIAAPDGPPRDAVLWAALGALEESSALRRRMADHARERGMSAIADAYAKHAHESEMRAQSVRRSLLTGDVDRLQAPLQAAAANNPKRQKRQD